MNKNKSNKPESFRESENSKVKNDGTSKSQLGVMWRKFKRNRLGQLGLVILGFLVLLILFAPFFAPYDYYEPQSNKSFYPPQRVHFVDQKGRFHLKPFAYKLEEKIDPETFTRTYQEDHSKRYPVKFFVHTWEYKLWGIIKTDLHLFGVKGEGSLHIFGTDRLGRDLYSRILVGGRITLSVALIATLMTTVLGSILGAVSGYLGGTVDMIIQRLVEVMRSFPRLALWVSLSAAIPLSWDPIYVVYGVTLVFAVLSWPALCRQVRGKVMDLKNEDFVMAARAVGSSQARIITRHVLPQATSHIIVVMTVQIPRIILGLSALSFIGLGVQPPMVSWGVLLKKAQNFQTLSKHPWIMFPGLFIFIAVLGFNFLGDGLRDATDPFSE